MRVHQDFYTVRWHALVKRNVACISMMQHHLQSVKKPVVKCKACKPKAEHKINIEDTPKKSNSHSITARNIAKHTRTDRVTLSDVWATPGLAEATLNNMQVSSENTQVHPKFGNGHDGEFAGLSGSG